MTTSSLATALASIDAWLDTMRGRHGYTGPVAHWWESNFVYTGALYDWRYEGIIDGYRLLYLKTGEAAWLQKSMRAADDTVQALLPDGRFRRSSFQFGPVRGGTPHEAAVDVSLLALAETLRQQGSSAGEAYLQAARTNLERYWIGTLWNGDGFQDQTYNPVLVANKHGTVLEALLLLERLTGREVDEYLGACVRAVERAQVHEGPQAGGTVHFGIGPSRLAIPIYTARAMNGILSYYLQRHDPTVVPMMAKAVAFLAASITSEGVVWGVYGDGRPCTNPRMVAGAGDVLRFLGRVRDHDLADSGRAVDRLADAILGAQRPSGAVPTACGFSRMGLSGADTATDLRDEVPVVGWVDKSFRAFCSLLPQGATLPPAAPVAHATTVVWRGRRHRYTEGSDAIRVRDRHDRTVYAWRKGERAPDVYGL